MNKLIKIFETSPLLLKHLTDYDTCKSLIREHFIGVTSNAIDCDYDMPKFFDVGDYNVSISMSKRNGVLIDVCVHILPKNNNKIIAGLYLPIDGGKLSKSIHTDNSLYLISMNITDIIFYGASTWDRATDIISTSQPKIYDMFDNNINYIRSFYFDYVHHQLAKHISNINASSTFYLYFNDIKYTFKTDRNNGNVSIYRKKKLKCTFDRQNISERVLNYIDTILTNQYYYQTGVSKKLNI